MTNRLFIFLLFLVSSNLGWTQEKNFIDRPYLETSADVDTLVTPDLIYLKILISESDTKGKESVEKMESTMLSVLKSLEIDTEKNLVLNDLASNFKNYFLKPSDILKTKSYTLEVSDARTAGMVILNLEKINISNVYLDRTEYSKTTELLLQLKSIAIQKAQNQARHLVEPLNQTLGPAIFISDEAYPNTDISSSLSGRVSGIVIRGVSSITSENSIESKIDFEKIQLKVKVHVKFAIN